MAVEEARRPMPGRCADRWRSAQPIPLRRKKSRSAMLDSMADASRSVSVCLLRAELADDRRSAAPSGPASMVHDWRIGCHYGRRGDPQDRADEVGGDLVDVVPPRARAIHPRWRREPLRCRHERARHAEMAT